MPGTRPPGPNSFIFMQFSAKNLQNNPNLGIGAPPREIPGSVTAYHACNKTEAARPNSTKVLLLPPANKVCEGYVFTSVCHSVHRAGSLHPGVGVCIQEGSASRGDLHPGGSASGGSATGGVCLWRGLHPGGGVLGRPPGALQDTVNKRAVRIILECILAHIRIFVALLKRSVNGTFITTTSQKMNQLAV